MDAVRKRKGRFSGGGEWKEILQRDNERKSRGGNEAADIPFPLWASVLGCVWGAGLSHFHFQLLHLNVADALLSVVENETQ